MKLIHIISTTGLFILGATEALRNDTNVKRETPECRWHRRSLNARYDSDDDFCFGLQPADDALWHAAKCKGGKLLLGTTQNAPEAARFVNPINSPWDGEMRDDLAKWGWKDGVTDPDTECNMNFLRRILSYLGTTTGSHLYGGPNYCFSVKHCDSDRMEKDENGNMYPRKEQYYDVDGSPNGRAAGFFLAQHKPQLSGNRWVKTIRVFRVDADSSAPHIFFFVGPAPYPPPQVPDDLTDPLIPPPAQAVEVAKRVSDEKNIVRQHILRAKL
ncbi:hypothetical protein J4E93_005304 [Alternaria ventricosa]|uniref:uncharacterized protein n=1 Tax=Alternaria ventricosa TaxID=1187951 RepID=UPI0020C3B407|nr:uncharacterized protein J4E93_005304 [Alternaria ventricosa]KAI4645726.1 hypothetical protein J4E93_005304 [Alternaria ventricosa]